MATTTFIQDLTLTDIAAFRALLDSELTTKGWVRSLIDTNTAVPTLAGRKTWEAIYRSPGDGVDLGRFYIWIAIQRDNNGTRASIALNAFTSLGTEGLVSVNSASKSGTTLTIDTAAAHGFSVGDLVMFGGSSDPDLNVGKGGTNTANGLVLTTPSATQFTMLAGVSQTVAAAAGGFCWRPINSVASWTSGINDFMRINPDNASIDFIGGVDEFGLTGTAMQGVFRLPFFVGCVGRGHIPAQMSQTFTATGAITGTGSVQAIPVDQVPVDILAKQPIDIVNEGDPGILRTQVDSVGPGNVLNCLVPVGQNFNAGSVIGWDPMPIMVAGAAGTTRSTLTLNGTAPRFAYSIDGTRSWAQNDLGDADSIYTVVEPRVGTTEKSVGDTLDVTLQALQTFDIMIVKSSGTAAIQGARGPWRNAIGVVQANQNDFDFLYTGRTLPDDIYKALTTQNVNTSTDHVAYGPNVPGATPLP